MFKNRYGANKRGYSCSGSNLYTVRILNTSDGVVPFLVDVSVKNIQDDINSYKDSCDIYKLLRDFLNDGSLPTVNIEPGINDISSMPTDIFEITNIINNAKSVYNRSKSHLNGDVDFNTFISSLADQDSFSKLFKPIEVKDDVKNEEN